MLKRVLDLTSWLIVLWICKVFLFSLPYKFTLHPDTQHIFGTIGAWMEGIFGEPIGQFFAHYGAYFVGSFELLTSLLLLAPVFLLLLRKLGVRVNLKRHYCHALGGLMASTVMAGAVFFHLFTPLGIEVIHQGESDHGSLFYAALSILVLGVLLFFINRVQCQDDCKLQG